MIKKDKYDLKKWSGKYNITINILFWTLLAVVTCVFSIVLLKPELKLNSFLFGTQTEVIVKKEPVVIIEYRELEKESEWFYFVATAYSMNDAKQGTNETTSTGKQVREGIIAVDPDVIPYGTIVEIKGMGYFVAEDCGAKIKGNRIDIYFDSKHQAKEFGKQGLWIRIVRNYNFQVAGIRQAIIDNQ